MVLSESMNSESKSTGWAFFPQKKKNQSLARSILSQPLTFCLGYWCAPWNIILIPRGNNHENKKIQAKDGRQSLASMKTPVNR